MSDSPDEPVEEGTDEPEITEEDRLRMMREQEEKFLAIQRAKGGDHPTSQRAMARQLLESPTYFDSAEYSLGRKTGRTNVGIGAGVDGDEPSPAADDEESRARLMKQQEQEMLERLGSKSDVPGSTAAKRAIAKQMLKQPAIFDSAEYSLHGKVGVRNIGIGKGQAAPSVETEGEDST